jgi:hypothetical protein
MPGKGSFTLCIRLYSRVPDFPVPSIAMSSPPEDAPSSSASAPAPQSTEEAPSTDLAEDPFTAPPENATYVDRRGQKWVFFRLTGPFTLKVGDNIKSSVKAGYRPVIFTPLSAHYIAKICSEWSILSLCLGDFGLTRGLVRPDFSGSFALEFHPYKPWAEKLKPYEDFRLKKQAEGQFKSLLDRLKGYNCVSGDHTFCVMSPLDEPGRNVVLVALRAWAKEVSENEKLVWKVDDNPDLIVLRPAGISSRAAWFDHIMTWIEGEDWRPALEARGILSLELKWIELPGGKPASLRADTW